MTDKRGNGNGKGKGRSKGRSGFPSGMTDKRGNGKGRNKSNGKGNRGSFDSLCSLRMTVRCFFRYASLRMTGFVSMGVGWSHWWIMSWISGRISSSS